MGGRVNEVGVAKGMGEGRRVGQWEGAGGGWGNGRVRGEGWGGGGGGGWVVGVRGKVCDGGEVGRGEKWGWVGVLKWMWWRGKGGGEGGRKVEGLCGWREGGGDGVGGGAKCWGVGWMGVSGWNISVGGSEKRGGGYRTGVGDRGRW